MTAIQKEVLNGALLGDGCLYLHKNAVNANFQYTSKSRQHVEFVTSFLKDQWSGKGITGDSYFDKRTNKTYYRFSYRTYVNKTFTNEYYRWYISGVKIIPHDLILTPLTCLIWYLGDGCINRANRSEFIKIATHCFAKEDLEGILLPQLKNFEASLIKAKDDQYFIYIPHRMEELFLNYIGECPFSDYEYKWNYKKYKYSLPKNHKGYEKDFCNMFMQGMTYYSIAKHFGIEPNAVKYYLKKHGLYPRKELNVCS